MTASRGADWAYLEELEHAQGTVRGPVVWPGGELEMTNVSLLARQAGGDLQIGHYEVLVVLNILRSNPVVPALNAGA